MTIAVVTFVTNLNKDLERAETITTIDSVLKRALRDITIRIPALKKSDTVSVTVGKAEYDSADLPSDFRDVISIRINSGKPLTRIENFDAYLRKVADEGTGEWDEPTHFCIHNKKLYLWHTPDASYTATLDYSAITVATDTIELADEYEDCLYFGLCWFYLVSIELAQSQKGKTYFGLYEKALGDLGGLTEQREGPKRTDYQDV